jgi:hypothetical protein
VERGKRRESDRIGLRRSVGRSRGTTPGWTRVLVQGSDDAPDAAWVRCDRCEYFWCRIHKLHVYDCSCPTLEEWLRQHGTDPYSAPEGDSGRR